jgi:hypothetical protein
VLPYANFRVVVQWKGTDVVRGHIASIKGVKKKKPEANSGGGTFLGNFVGLQKCMWLQPGILHS